MKSTVERDNNPWSKIKRKKTISIAEENAVRYVAGFVVMKMEMFMSREMMAIHECLLSMEEGTTKGGANEESFLAYTCSWLQLINRDGLFTVRDDVYSFFLELELCAYPLLKQRLDVEGSSETKSELLQAIKSDEDVLFALSMVTLDLSKEDSCLLLASVVELWVVHHSRIFCGIEVCGGVQGSLTDNN